MATPTQPWLGTHLLTFTSGNGGATDRWSVMLSGTVRPSGWRSAHTQDEWTGGRAAGWTVDQNGSWKHWGQATPAGAAGSLEVVESLAG